MRTGKAAFVRTALISSALLGAYVGLLRTPQPFFLWSLRCDRLTLYSDRLIPEAAGKRIIELAAGKLSLSPLYSGPQDHHVFICNSRWRQMLFFNKDYGVGGVAQYPVTANVFLREAWIEDNRLLSSRGSPVMGDRTLDYFLAHEITHQLTGRFLGPIRYVQSPQWVREGYADYVGKGSSFQYNEAKRAFLAGAPEMDWKKSGLYWRFHLLVAYLLDHQHWSLEQLLKNPPPQAAVDAAINSEKS
jgi:hypothetical protein